MWRPVLLCRYQLSPPCLYNITFKFFWSSSCRRFKQFPQGDNVAVYIYIEILESKYLVARRGTWWRDKDFYRRCGEWGDTSEVWGKEGGKFKLPFKLVKAIVARWWRNWGTEPLVHNFFLPSLIAIESYIILSETSPACGLKYKSNKISGYKDEIGVKKINYRYIKIHTLGYCTCTVQYSSP